jgi:hypothetical protein
MTEYKTETIEHLGLVSSMIDELGIVSLSLGVKFRGQTPLRE